ncbi:DEAD/DEAH box helicase [Fructilactobacillus sp. Tb1]|uniref:DEAD/DEAH box helicase n=1 Tax=Fructilactobacillus sp. Tb1 TaxID=3422304 RepID=UPI003D2A2485
MRLFKLRDYQQETVDGIIKSIKKGNHAIMITSPPRTGKTVVMAEIARRATAKGNRVLFIVHRKEIVDQAKITFKQQSVNMKLCTLGMVQTFTRRVDKLKPPDLIFIDEAHHVLGKTYLRIINAFPRALKLLFTATPIRLNGKGFTDVVTDLVPGKQVSWLIKHKMLAPVDYYAPKAINVARLKVKRNGEFDTKSIEQAIKPKIYGNAVKNYKKLAAGKQAIAYCYNVASAEKLAAEFNRKGIKAASVSGNTPKDKRKQIINDYRNGKIMIVTNAELFTEGLDLPNVDCVIQLRPTQSLSLFLQFSMRSMNPRKGKRAVIIDHVGNVERFGLPTDDRNWTIQDTKSIKGTNNASSTEIKPVTVCEQCFATFYRTNDKCPFCGADLKREETIEVDEDAKLEKVEAIKRKERIDKILNDGLTNYVADKRPSELNNMEQLKAYAKLKGYKRGWIFYQAKQKGLIR